jgi:hypothetical protein
VSRNMELFSLLGCFKFGDRDRASGRDSSTGLHYNSAEAEWQTIMGLIFILTVDSVRMQRQLRPCHLKAQEADLNVLQNRITNECGTV